MNKPRNFYYSPQKIDIPFQITQVGCGHSHIVALTVEGDVYTWGDGTSGQLGIGVGVSSTVPRLVLEHKCIHQVQAGRYHNVALSKHGLVYAWGLNDNGQCGQDAEEIIFVPKLIDSLHGKDLSFCLFKIFYHSPNVAVRWSKLAPDVEEHIHAENQEYQLKVKASQRSSKGLSKKHYYQISHEVKQNNDNKKKQKTLEKAHEKETIDKQAAKILSKNKLQLQLSAVTSNNNSNNLHSSLKNSGKRNSRRMSQRTHNYSNFHDNENRVPLVHNQRGMNLTRKFGKNKTDLQNINNNTNSNNSNCNTIGNKNDPTFELNSPHENNTNSSRNSSPRKQHVKNNSNIDHLNQHPAEELHKVKNAAATTVATKQITAALSQTSNKKKRDHVITHISRMAQVFQMKGKEIAPAELENEFQLLCEKRKLLDHLKNTTRSKNEYVDSLHETYTFLRESEDDMTNVNRKFNQKIAGLKHELDTVLIKLAEAEENKKNYELNLSFLKARSFWKYNINMDTKEEEMERFFNLEALRQEYKEATNISRKIKKLKTEYTQQKEISEFGLKAFEQDVSQFNIFAQKCLKELSHITQIETSNRKQSTLVKCIIHLFHFLNWIKQCCEQKQKIREQTLAAKKKIEALEEALETKESQTKELKNTLQILTEQYLHHTEHFRQLSNACGADSTTEIIDRFFLMQEMFKELSLQLTEAVKKRDQLSELQVFFFFPLSNKNARILKFCFLCTIHTQNLLK
ncbi:hect E3 ubiquitin ligase [Reticulomyxa filosa]|uniref:Hect E3 ubiquitin ligase n=1 Tax=Reticulomyxa filosa TaxID=46433 RepID=X6N1F2_RETFI|nr:hect E3 ubiquitin ligase [Reticulomyxa filosa]|eukprot:ETO19743.1 hect E3 ubiquitin ligase [Reticulomyxa filosa]